MHARVGAPLPPYPPPPLLVTLPPCEKHDNGPHPSIIESSQFLCRRNLPGILSLHARQAKGAGASTDGLRNGKADTHQVPLTMRAAFTDFTVLDPLRPNGRG